MDENIKRVKSFYSVGSAVDDMRIYTNKKLKQWENQVIAKFPVNATVLNIGCGMGREAFCLYEKGFKVTGIDISEKVIETAKKSAAVNNVKIDFLLSDGLNLDFPDLSFDVVIIWSQTFGLFYGENNKQHILNECKRVLKNNGLFSFSGHDREYLLENYPQRLKENKFYPYDDIDCYWETFTSDELSGYAHEAGFNNIKSEVGLIYTEDDGTILHCTCFK